MLLTEDPATLAASFRSAASRDELAVLLGLRPDQLIHYAYGRGHRYKTFSIRKRRGGLRIIREPESGLKIIQQRMAQVFGAIENPRSCAHGFVREHSIGTNALEHVGRDWVFNVDLKDFFPSINFGRVRGILINRFGINPNVASVMARLCTYNNELPQGAPTSPVLSNMVAGALDRDLQRLARRFGCSYTRYADDLTFSRNGKFPDAIGFWDPIAMPRRVSRIGDRLTAAITRNGFETHPDKVRLSFRDERQLVTGLVVNNKVNVRRVYGRRIRAMLHAWRMYGEAKAETEFYDRYDTKDRAPHSRRSFRRVVKGHIDFLGMIRGTDDHLYRSLLLQYASLVPGYAVRPHAKRRPNHLQTWKDAIFVIETDNSQGTAFFLEGYGVVTCAHVIRDITRAGHPAYANPRIYSHRNEALEYRVTETGYDADLDVALLRFDGPAGAALVPKAAPLPNIGDPVKAVGWPGYNSGHPLWEETGVITHIRAHMGGIRLVITPRIVEGASGSPLMDMNNRVIGIATVGVPSVAATSMLGPEIGAAIYGGVPIQALDRLR